MSNIIKNYSEYIKLQKEKYSSLESNDNHWSAGQRRFIEIAFSECSRNLKIIDIACGDGVGLREFKRLGFQDVTGVEFNDTKIKLAKKIGYPVVKSDLHNLKEVKNKYDIIYSSHTLEHMLYPKKALKQFSKHLIDSGLLFIVIPYPDLKIESEQAHVARNIIGSNIYDDAKSVIKFFGSNGFKIIDKFYDTFREPEIWLVFKKNNSNKTIKCSKFYDKLNDPSLTPAFYLNFSYNIQKKSQA